MSASQTSVYVLTDFGSTYTKVTLADMRSGLLVGHAQSPTTAATDVMIGFADALARALSAAGRPVVLGPRLSASSAGGGLRVAAVGLVSDLTAAAARQAALNAGGRVDLVLSGPLGPSDMHALRHAAPDIVLFCGGTDGGQRDRVLSNAEVLARAEAVSYAVVACNREIADEVTVRLQREGVRTLTVENTMPRLGELNIGPARGAILRAFLEHVIRGKALSSSSEFTDSVVTATPDAVLRGVELLASGTEAQPRVGRVAVVDIGGATTDVHSHAADPQPIVGGATPLIPVLPTVRTVQGDLGMRHSAGGVLTADRKWLQGRLGTELDAEMRAREMNTDLLPADERAATVDRKLAVSCATLALRRHCGRQYWGFRRNEPPRLHQTGPDLRSVEVVIGTGGVLALGPDGDQILSEALVRGHGAGDLMTPQSPRIALDRNYMLAAAGLLSTCDPDVALRFVRSEFASVSVPG
jgi:uncharacterized protein (TIGR01319 family)